MTYFEYCDAQAQYCEEQARRFMEDTLLRKFWIGAADMFSARLRACSVKRASMPVSPERERLLLEREKDLL